MKYYEFDTLNGITIKDADTVRADVEAEFREALGENLNTSSSTPQGRLIDAEVISRISALELARAQAMQISPLLSGGRNLDALCSFLRLKRQGPSRSVLTGVQVTGRPGTSIPIYSQAPDVHGVLWRTTSGFTFGSNGTATVDFEAVEPGPTECDTGELNVLPSSVLGWETVYNPTPATPGALEWSDPRLRRVRENTLALQGVSVMEAITSQLYAPPISAVGVAIRENISDKSRNIDGIAMAPRSIWVCVQGGQPEQIGLALLKSKTIGAQWVGKESVNVTDPFSLQPYTVKFDRPTFIDIEVKLTVEPRAYPGNAVEDATAAVVQYADGLIDSYDGFNIKDNDVSPSTISGAVQNKLRGLTVFSCQVRRLGASSWSSEPIELAIKECPRTSSGLVDVEVRT